MIYGRIAQCIQNIGSRRRFAQSLFAVAALLLTVGAPITLAQQTATGPKLELLVKDLDFGEVTRGQIVEASFELKNVGDEPLNVVRVKPG